jgi:MoaA/NifB/PqqE/SkfB family radical SAM enzyme
VNIPADLFADLPKPEPAAGVEYYQSQKQVALQFSEVRRENYDRYLEWRKGRGLVNFLPVKLDIENVSRCNFKCSMCVVSDWHKGQRAHDLSFDEFKAIIDEQEGLVEIKLQGIGEPLMQGDEFFEMIRYARDKAIWVRTTTNASLLHLRDNYKKLIDSGVNEVQISIDGADAETFEAIRRGSVFKQVVENCKMINAYSASVGLERTKMWTVVQESNITQLESLVDIAADLGFTNQVFMMEPIGWGIDSWIERNQTVSVSESLNPTRLHQLVQRGMDKNVRVAFWLANEKYSTNSKDTLCPWPFERSYVGSDSRVSPCCMIGNPDVAEIGADNDGSFRDIWFSTEYQEFRDAHEQGRIPNICKGCYDAD